MATSTPQPGTASVEECEDYIEKHGIQGLLKDCIAKICQEQPANPYKWLAAYFNALDKKVCEPLALQYTTIRHSLKCMLRSVRFILRVIDQRFAASDIKL